VVTRIQIKTIKPNPLQPRKDFDRESIEELAESIRQKGVLQPVLVRAAGEGYELVAGERRLRAAKLAGLKVIPAIVYAVESDADMLELSIIENVQREDLNPIDTAMAYQMLVADCSLTQEQVSERVGKSRVAVTNKLRLLSLPAEVQKKLRAGDLSEGHARALLGLSTKKEQVELSRKVIGKGLSVREVERLVRQLTEQRGRGREKKEKGELSPRLRAIVEEMQRSLGTRITLTGSEKKGALRIEYYSPDDLTRICDRLDINLD
jgi:ParB family chromosome partitioning protein